MTRKSHTYYLFLSLLLPLPLLCRAQDAAPAEATDSLPPEVAVGTLESLTPEEAEAIQAEARRVCTHIEYFPEGTLLESEVERDGQVSQVYVADAMEPVFTPTWRKYPGGKALPIYFAPYSLTYNAPNWGRYWANVGLLAGAMVGALSVMECLPEDATNWNRAEIQDIPLFKRWWRNIFVRNPEIDGDDWYFNYFLHPYAGAVYFMAGRSAGLNFWRSMLTSAFVSTVLWEFGVEAFVERPSYQDLVITPVVGSVIGELFYRVKRDIVCNDYHLWGSSFMGHLVAFLVDPVNEFLDLFRGNPCKGYVMSFEGDRREYRDVPNQYSVTSSLMPTFTSGHLGFQLTIGF